MSFIILFLFFGSSVTLPVRSGCELDGSCKRIGDMMINKRLTTLAGIKDYRWPHGQIPYEFDESVKNQTWKLELIQEAISELNSFLCVNFRPRVLSDEVGIRIFNGLDYPKECWSDVGFYPPEFNLLRGNATKDENDNFPEYFQVVTISDLCSKPYGIGENKETTKGTVMHELIHSLGFYHTHARSDRDRYVKIHYANIAEENRNQFDYASDASGGQEIDNYGVPYNYQSIMHYPPNARGNPVGSITIEATPPENDPRAIGNPREMGHECYLTKEDVDMINNKYEQEDSCAKPRPKWKPAVVSDGHGIC